VKRFIAGEGRKKPELAGVIIPEPTDFEVVTAHRGLLWLEVSTKGKTAHGSTPELGINAIESMRKLLDELDDFEIKYERHELLGDCTFSVNTINAGEAINVVPDRCSIGVDIRTVPGQRQKDIIKQIEGIFEKLKGQDSNFDAEVKVERQVGSLETDVESGFVKEFCEVVGAKETKAVGFTTDGAFVKDLGAPVVIFGPGEPEVCHKPDEFIEISDLEKGVEYYKSIILRFLA
jgi:succinyl-diaminopimelate desuccinylase